MKNVKMTIKGKQVPLSFGYGSQKRLGDFLGEDTYDGTAQKISSVINSLANKEKEGGKLSFDILDTLGYMILSAAGNNPDFEMEDAVDAILNDMDKVKEVVEAWADGIPVSKKEPAAPKKKDGEQEKIDPLTWDDLEELCLGKLGMSFMELDNISMRRLFNKLRGYREKEREEWEKLRLQCYFAFSPIDPDDPEKKRLQGLLDFMPFDWDDDLPKEDHMEKIKEDARERRERSQKLWAKIDGIE